MLLTLGLLGAALLYGDGIITPAISVLSAVEGTGSVVLVVTGVEALDADMGHFGTSPIRRAWYKIVLPGLVLN